VGQSAVSRRVYSTGVIKTVVSLLTSKFAAVKLCTCCSNHQHAVCGTTLTAEEALIIFETRPACNHTANRKGIN